MLNEVLLVSIEHSVQPRKELLGAVIGVENNWDAVCWGNGADVVGRGDGAGDRGELVSIGDALLEVMS